MAESMPDRSELDDRAGEFDRSNMATVIERLPDQIEIALEQQLPAIPSGPFNQVVLAGMGGSALPMDVVTGAFASRLKVPVRAWRHYDPPPSIDAGTLVIASSFSGNTEETLSAIAKAPRSAAGVSARS